MNEAQSKFKALLGLGYRAGKVISGNRAVWTALVKQKVSLLILAKDASIRTQNEFCRMSEKMATTWIFIENKEVLGACTGQSPRAVLAITDQQLAKAILQAVRPES